MSDFRFFIAIKKRKYEVKHISDITKKGVYSTYTPNKLSLSAVQLKLSLK